MTTRIRRLLTAIVLFGAILLLALAVPARSLASPSDATHKQLNALAIAAIAQLNEHVPGGEGEILSSLAVTLSGSSAIANDDAVVTVGQLKTLAKPFYDRLFEIGYTDRYPWTDLQLGASDNAIVDIEKVRNVFSFDVMNTDKTHDTDHDGLPDWWELHYFGSLGENAEGDFDHDGFSNLKEFQDGDKPNRRNPKSASNFHINANGDGSMDYTWQDNSDDEEYFKVGLWRDDGTSQFWYAPPNTTHFHITPAQRWPHGKPTP
ncbi:MAG: hypothetical protein QOD99_2922 [Chthoniobacter sp.]|jgi:hypothetical protein|nr:hypothetical protein [Chthoniobacter sp.]